MELTFIVSAAVIFLMIAFRMLEIKLQRPIVLAHLSWPVDKRLRNHFKKVPLLMNAVKAYIQGLKDRVRAALTEKKENLQSVADEYLVSLRESLRGKRALSRGSVSFFLLNISDYGREKAEAIPVPVEDEKQEVEG